MSPRRAAMLAAVTVALATAGVATAATSSGASPTRAVVRPGPPILYAPAADAPQLQNTGIWHAAPILVSGASAYRDGEYLYQDYLYDDHGATQIADTSDPRTYHNNQFSAPNGTYTYPSSMPTSNEADLVEVRVKPTTHATAFRFTLNTMIDPTRIALSAALGGRAGVTHPLPFGANTSAPGDVFVTVHPRGRRLVVDVASVTSGRPLTGGSVTVDTARRQITVLVPHRDWDPGARTARLTAAVGLWDRDANRYLVPTATASATQPGGAGTASNPSAFFNVAFRYREPMPEFGAASAKAADGNAAWWRDASQGAALATQDLSPLYATVDFGRLKRKVDDDAGVPKTGHLDRILASHFEPAQGTNYADSCYGGTYHCQYQGRLQPYALYVPKRAPAKTGYGMTLLLHANASNYNEFLGSHNAEQFGDRGTGSVVLTPEARDPGSSYIGLGAADVFEAWADVARHYSLDATWRTVSGYSLGGLGTFKFAEQFPDLFSRAVAIVGSPGGPVSQDPQSDELASLRNIPIMVWDVVPVDELNAYSQINVIALQKLGYRYDYLMFPGEHLTPSIQDEYGPAAAFLGTHRVEPNPAHVSYVYSYDTLDGLSRSTGDVAGYGLVADHAYWLSALKLRTVTSTCRGNTTPGCGAIATIDATSGGFGTGEPTPSGPQPGAGVASGGALVPALPYVEVKQTWGPAPSQRRENALRITATNLKALTVDVHRAKVDCQVHLTVHTDGPLAVTLLGCGRTLSFR